MFKSLFVSAMAFAAAASAASWPMVTVNSAGDIVLNAPTRAESFQLTPASVTAAPTTGTTVSLTSVTALDSTIDNYVVSIPSTLNTNGGFKLPTPTAGRTITLFNDGTTPLAYTVWTSATSVFFGNSVTSVDIESDEKWVKFVATSSTNWAVIRSQSAATNGITNLNLGTGSAAVTLSTAEVINGFYTYTGTTAAGVAVTTPTASAIEAALPNAAVGDSFEFTLYASSSGAATLTAGTTVTFSRSSDGFVPAGNWARFQFRRTAASAFTVIKVADSGFDSITTYSAAFTLTAADSGRTFYTATTALTLTLPSCTASTVGINYKFYVDVAGTLVTTVPATDTMAVTSHIAGANTVVAYAAGATVTLTGAALLTAATGNTILELTCATTNKWSGISYSNAVIA